MGKQIIRVSPDRDLYMEWSSIVEAPTFIGTRAELAAHLVEDFKEGTDRHAREVDQAELRLLRADQIGSSAHPPWGCTWADSDGEIYQQQGYLPRARFGEFADRWLNSSDDVEPDVSDLLEPFGDR